MSEEPLSLLTACGLPHAWAGQRQWRVLETCFGLGHNFLHTWAAWRADPQRPQCLHFIACETSPASAQEVLHAAQQQPALQPLAAQLALQFWGLLSGVQRLTFEGGQVQLTLYVGDAQSMLRQQKPQADSVYLSDASPQSWNLNALKTLARCCRQGTRLVTCVADQAPGAGEDVGMPAHLRQCGFEVREWATAHPFKKQLHARFAPQWQPRTGLPLLADAALTPWPTHPRALVVGAGLAGASVAYSLARRGWQVTVLDAGAAPAGGASGLPAGLFAPHVSVDDSLPSRLSRAGVRLLLQHLHHLAADAQGQWWAPSGVLEHRVGASGPLPQANSAQAAYSSPASAQALSASGLPADSVALWHTQAGWVRPEQWVRRLLAQPGITWQGQCTAAAVQPCARDRLQPNSPTQWQALDAQGTPLGQGDVLVLCAGLASTPLAGLNWPLQALRGQVSWGWHQATQTQEEGGSHWPAQPVNGHGNLVPDVPMPEGRAWVLGSTFERDCTALPPTAQHVASAHQANFAKLQELLAPLAQTLAPCFNTVPAQVQHWAGVRCAAPDRLPLVGPLDWADAAGPQPGLWLSSAMGARGLSLSLLCAELLAARLHGEPLALDIQLAKALSTERMHKNQSQPPP